MNTHDLKRGTIDRIVRLARIDPRLCGCMLLGYAAQDLADECDRIELCLVIYNDHSVVDVFTDWQRRLCAILPTLSAESSADVEDGFELSFLLNGPLEVSVRFLSSNDIQATGAHWQVLFDRVGDLDWRMKVLWVKKTAARRVVPEYEERMASIKHRVHLARAALETGRLWQAFVDMQDIRKRVIDLHALRTGEDALRNRALDKIDSTLLHRLETTVCTALTRAEVGRALQAIIECYLEEVRTADEVYELDVADQVQSLVQGLPCCVCATERS
ncbi:MAG: hypothetical protein GF331_07470 [Chitinivibrionales bacterium]|nr:hypothetical protein [Chitinivibrionales bacterium]